MIQKLLIKKAIDTWKTWLTKKKAKIEAQIKEKQVYVEKLIKNNPKFVDITQLIDIEEIITALDSKEKEIRTPAFSWIKEQIENLKVDSSKRIKAQPKAKAIIDEWYKTQEQILVIDSYKKELSAGVQDGKDIQYLYKIVTYLDSKSEKVKKVAYDYLKKLIKNSIKLELSKTFTKEAKEEILKWIKGEEYKVQTSQAISKLGKKVENPGRFTLYKYIDNAT